MGLTSYLGDKSALARLHLEAVRAELAPLIDRGLVHVCAPTELELLTSARNVDDYEHIRNTLLPGFSWVPMGEQVWQRCLEVHHALAQRGQHRCASIPDLLLAATAEARDLTLLHYDHDFDTIAEVTGQPTQWVVPPGTV